MQSINYASDESIIAFAERVLERAYDQLSNERDRHVITEVVEALCQGVEEGKAFIPVSQGLLIAVLDVFSKEYIEQHREYYVAKEIKAKHDVARDYYNDNRGSDEIKHYQLYKTICEIIGICRDPVLKNRNAFDLFMDYYHAQKELDKDEACKKIMKEWCLNNWDSLIYSLKKGRKIAIKYISQCEGCNEEQIKDFFKGVLPSNWPTT